MKKIHLKINYGGEERYEFVRKTIIVSAPYFTTVTVLNFGLDEKSDRFLPLMSQFSNFSIANLGKYYHQTITEDLLRYQVMHIPDGEWILWLDSDWRLPLFFLENMQKEVETCESQGKTSLFSYQIGHSLTDINAENGHGTYIWNYTVPMVNKLVKSFTERPDSYGFPLIQKVDKNAIWCDSVTGNHCYYLFVPYLPCHIPSMYHFHFRHFDDHAYCSTKLFQQWGYVGHNDFEIEHQREISNSWEYKSIEDFKIKHNCCTNESLRILLKDAKFVDELRALFMLFDKTKINGCQEFYRLADKYDMKIWSTPLQADCNGVCCHYKEGRIFNI